MRKLLLLVMALMCLTFPARAEDVCTVNAAEASYCITDRSYLRVKYPLEGTQHVTMTICDDWGYLVYQRDHGMCSGTFRSDDVYLTLYGGSTAYTVTLEVDGVAHSIRVTREQPRLTDSGVCAWGLPLREMTGRSSNQAAVILDAYALEGSVLTVPMVSSGMQLGYVHFAVQNGKVTVSADLAVDGEVLKASVYVARDAVTAENLGTNRFNGKKMKLERAIDLGGTPYAAVLVQLTVAYDAATAMVWEGDDPLRNQQADLWQLMQLTTANEAVG